MANVMLICGVGAGQRRYGRLEKMGSYLPTYGTLCIGSVLENAGHKVTLIDREVSPITNEDIVAEVQRQKPDVVGMSVFTIALDDYLSVAKSIKESCDVPLIAGGPHVFVDKDGLQEEGYFDYMVPGEGERTIVELMQAIEAGRGAQAVPGALARTNGKWVDGGHRKTIDNLDELPFPAFHLLGDIWQYRPTPFGYRRLPHLPIVASRGCPFACNFCSNIWGRKWRAHSAEYVVELIKYMMRDFGVREVWFVEDTFAIDRQRVVGICEGIIKAGLDIVWTCMTNAHILDEELLKLMRRAGCWQIQLGLESGNDRVLKSTKKPITTRIVREKVTLINKCGIKVRGYFILGHLTDTKESIQDTINFACSIPLYTAEFHLLVLSMGAEVREKAHEYGKVDYDKSKLSAYTDSGLSFVPHGLTEAEMYEFKRRGHNRFFLRPRVMAKYLADIRSWTDIQRYWMMMQAFFANMLPGSKDGMDTSDAAHLLGQPNEKQTIPDFGGSGLHRVGADLAVGAAGLTAGGR